MSYQPPQTRVFTEFAESTTVTAAELSACLVGPYYDVHDNVKLGSYASTATTYPYVDLDGTDSIEPSDMANVFTCVLRNAQVQAYRNITYSDTEGTAGFIGSDGKSLLTGMTVANGGGVSVPAGFPSLSIGDTVLRYGSDNALKSTNTVAGFLPANATSYGIGLAKFDTANEHSAGDITLGGTHTYTSDAVLVFTITAGGKIGTDSVKASLSINGGAAIQTNITCGTSAVSLSGATGLTTLTVSFATNVTWTTGDKISFGISAPTNYTSPSDMGYGVVVLTNAETSMAEGDYFVLYYNAGDIENPTGATFGAEGLTVTASLTSGGLSLYSGTFYATYRVRKHEFTEKVYTVGTTAELTGMIGAPHPLNPLSMMCSLALANSNGSSVTFVAVADDSDNAYAKAFEIVGTNGNAWAVTPYSESVTVQQYAFNAVKEFGSPENMNWKTAWLGYDTESIQTVMATLAGEVHTPEYYTNSGTESAATSNRIYVSAASYDITVLKAGDVIQYNGNTYTVVSVFTAVTNPYILINAQLAVGAVSGASVIRPVSAADKAAEVSAYASSFNSELVRVFYGDTPYLTAFPTADCPMSYVAAAWAGKRSGVPPHQSLTRSTIDGISFAGLSGFSTSELNEMGGAGVWLTITDSTDGTTYCRHQLTTKSQTENYNLKEDSKIANAHEISMTVRTALDVYYGRANVVDAALELIRLKSISVINNIQARAWSDLLGPQITELESISVEKDANYSDRVNVYINCATPDPLNNLDVYLTIR